MMYEAEIIKKELKKCSDDEWKPLEVDNLPPDIFKQNKEEQPIYEYEVCILGTWKRIDYIHNRIYDLVGGYDEHKYRYRKRQPEQPTDEELAEKYTKGMLFVYPPTVEQLNKSLQSAFIAGRKSATIPPEEEG